MANYRIMGDEGRLTLALPKGRLLPEVARLLVQAGLPGAGELADSRRLVVEAAEGGVRYLLARPADVVTYVVHGAADLGFTGKDVLLEETPAGVFELLDLGVGACHLAVAGPPARRPLWQAACRGQGRLKVATKFPSIARDYFARQGCRAEVIPLRGAVELAPLVGLADVILDLVATGRTLAANGLAEFATVETITARLIANAAGMRLRQAVLTPVVEALRDRVERGLDRDGTLSPSAGSAGC